MMHRAIDTYDHISIAEIVIYVPFLIISVFLGFRHGFRRSAGFYFLIILSLARIIGSALRLATISDATNTNLYAGWLTLNNLGLSPLILTLLSLVARVMDSIHRSGVTILQPRYRRAVDTILLVALILSIVGGTQSTYEVTASSGVQIQYASISRVALGLMLAGYVLLCVQTAMVALRHSLIEAGERRVLLAVALALPFVLVRIVSSCLRVFAGETATVWRYLGMEVIMEIVAVTICLGMGLTLRRVPKLPEGTRMEQRSGRRGGRRSGHRNRSSRNTQTV
ncbi:transmembrane protein [Phialemonium atrogriseum]|uniref:Transmembrane protein n=1 Tax=Phialemonium atrogriseum TaxID=1093897 RepID=A0AAJ0BW52_9PEZI|nr:uncharacterized protein QBC33DRAFT_543251 [Phialemonium atrogriseum]KAK1765579.1 transmembrane protein [Phialemonium atrogriseum]